jgi:hypothetical protein
MPEGAPPRAGRLESLAFMVDAAGGHGRLVFRFLPEAKEVRP